MTDAGLARLGGLVELEVLWCGNAEVTDAGLASLVKLKKLDVLELNGNPGVTDEGVRFLSENLPGLKHLLVSRTGVTDAGLDYLNGFTGLEGLQVEGQGAKITNAGLARLAGLVHLEVLNAGRSGVTDNGLGHLQGLRKLRWLNLNGTAIGDARPASLNCFNPEGSPAEPGPSSVTPRFPFNSSIELLRLLGSLTGVGDLCIAAPQHLELNQVAQPRQACVGHARVLKSDLTHSRQTREVGKNGVVHPFAGEVHFPRLRPSSTIGRSPLAVRARL